MTFLVPDLIEPVIGWRVWLVTRDASGIGLRSVMYDLPWRPREVLRARCLDKRVVVPHTHAAPAADCCCGIYGSVDVGRATAYLDDHRVGGPEVVHHVIGTVSLWGTVVECESGWRGERGYPSSIYVPARKPTGEAVPATEIALALVDYGVPVEILDGGTAAELVAELELELDLAA